MAMMLVIDWRLALVDLRRDPAGLAHGPRLPPAGARGVPRHPGPAGPAQRLSAGAALGHAGGAALRPGGRPRPSAFAELNQEHLEAHLRSITIYAVFFPVVEVLTAVAMALLLWYGGLRALGRHPHGGRAGGVHPATPAASSSRCRTSRRSSTCCRAPWPRRSGSSRCWTSRSTVRGAGRSRGRCRSRCGARSASRGSGSATRADGPWVLRDVSFTASPGADHRAGGPHRGGEDHDRQPAAPVLRSGPRPDHDRRGGHPRALHGRSARR